MAVVKARGPAASSARSGAGFLVETEGYRRAIVCARLVQLEMLPNFTDVKEKI